ncbi:MAG: hypothetical protein AB8B47_02795 [Roseobacter sp.]
MAEPHVTVNSIVQIDDKWHSELMIKRCICIPIVLVLSSCAPLEIYHQAGVTVSRMQSDLLSCEVDALRDAPVATQIRRAPPEYIPPHRFCRASGQCYQRGGYFIEGELYSFDQNASLRSRVEAQCMTQKGYTRAQIPNCKGTNTQSATPSTSDVLPVLTDTTCAIRNNKGGWQIIDANG